MSAQEQITKLQGLLARIQQNAARPRALAPLGSAAFAPPAPAAHAAAPMDNGVDELLGAAAELSPPPLEVDVPLDTLPPVAELEPVEEAIPLVPPMDSGPAVDDPFNLEQEVSEVRFTTGEREPAVEVTVSAIEAEAEQIPAEELNEDDLVEVTEGTPPPAATGDVDIDFDEPPASSQRSKVASSMDEALAAAAEQLDAEREVPLKTPPPESGPQEAPPPQAFAAPAAPDVDALLGHELDIPTREGATGHAGPTTEQLGQTIDLEEPRGPMLELAEQQAEPPPAPLGELEVALPGRDFGGGYDGNLQPPPEALDELEAHRRRQENVPPPPESLGQFPSIQPAAEAQGLIPPARLSGSPDIVERPQPMGGSPETYSSLRESIRTYAFTELLDASLSLYGE